MDNTALFQSLIDKISATPGVGGMKKEAMNDAIQKVMSLSNAPVKDPQALAGIIDGLSSKEALSNLRSKNFIKDAGSITGNAIGDAADYGKFSIKKAGLVAGETPSSLFPGIGSLIGVGMAAQSNNPTAVPREITDQVVGHGLQALGPAGMLAGAALSAEDLGPKENTPEYTMEDPDATLEQKRKAQMQLEALNNISNKEK